MPSLDDLDGLALGADRHELTVSLPSDDVLAAIKTEGGRRRARRHRRNSVIAGVAIALVAVPAIVLMPGGDPDTDEVTVAADSTTTSDVTVRESTTVTTEATTETTEVTPTSVAAVTPTTVPRTGTTVPVTTVPPLVCRNSRDPACGDFRWDPAPNPNQPLNAVFAAAPTQRVVGEVVTFIVDWSDGDAPFAGDYFSVDGTGLAHACTAIQRRFGPWTPPAAQPSEGSRSYTHTFTEPGTYTVTVSLWTGDCENPYASEADITTQITIVDAA